ncbi:aspartate aminotransferase family protein [Marinicauda salina]|uniref:Aspartate aminotransferase family protein n=1 Tax=Marinicauda salina TaxID=2135793 RepID=A0A2U2BY53_9PROT|nr:aspartate aminotransferase family protein [Marinicauda salina]
MTNAEILEAAFRRALAYRDEASDRPPRPVISPEDLQAAFDGGLPEHGEDGAAALAALAAAAEPGLNDTTGRRFFSWVIGASDIVGVAADWLAGAWGQNAGNYRVAPAASAAEQAAGAWLVDLLELPQGSSVGIVSGATMANFTGLAAGRSEVLRRAGWDLEEDGLQGAPRMRVLVGADAHSTVHAALRYLGFGRSQVEAVATNDQGAMDAADLERRLAAGDGPALVVAQAGQINTGACDPFDAIADACAKRGAWLHVDGAFGLWVRACPDRAHLAAGAERADSWATDAHKWLQAPYDAGVVIVRDPEAHRRAMSITASYLPVDERRPNPSDFVPELSRRARGFVIWTLLRRFGRAGVAEMVSRHCRLARRLADRLDGEPGLRVLNDVVMNQLIVGFGEDGPAEGRDAAARAVLAELRNRNEIFVEGARWRDREIMRVSVISGPLEDVDIDRAADAVLNAWRTVRADAPART